jgi:hypothetical protein
MGVRREQWKITVDDDGEYVYLRSMDHGSHLTTEIRFPISAATIVADWIRDSGQGRRQNTTTGRREYGLRWGT